MTKTKNYVCSRCGYRTIKKMDKCPTCGVVLEVMCCKCNRSSGDCECEKC